MLVLRITEIRELIIDYLKNQEPEFYYQDLENLFKTCKSLSNIYDFEESKLIYEYCILNKKIFLLERIKCKGKILLKLEKLKDNEYYSYLIKNNLLGKNIEFRCYFYEEYCSRMNKEYYKLRNEEYLIFFETPKNIEELSFKEIIYYMLYHEIEKIPEIIIDYINETEKVDIIVIIFCAFIFCK